jgi:hypothetical protein
VIERVRSLIHFPQTYNESGTKYEWLLLNAGDYDFEYLDKCPICYKEREDFWLATVRTPIRDSVNGDETKLSLALAIDMLWPCHWDFLGNLQVVLNAIGGRLISSQPFAACGRNITRVGGQDRLRIICATLSAFCGEEPIVDLDRKILDTLGETTLEKRWLAASLAKTIKLQLNPPSEMSEASALTGPEWIN